MAELRRLKVISAHATASPAAGTPAAPQQGVFQATPEIIRTVSRGTDGYEENLECNWGGNVRFFGTPAVPATLAELQSLVRDATPPLRVVGRGHSYVPLAECAGGTLISLARMNKVLDFQPPANGKLGSITIEGGTTYTEIAQFMGRRGALRNLPSAPHFTVPGATCTGTHGSGQHCQNLAADISAMEFVKADGTLVRYSREETPDQWDGVLMHMGCLGPVSRLTMDVVPYYEVELFLYEGVAFDHAIDILPRLWESCDSLSVWTPAFKGLKQECAVMFRHLSPHWDPSVAVPVHQPPKEFVHKGLVKATLPRSYTPETEPPAWFPSGKKPWHDGLPLAFDKCQETSMEIRDVQTELFVPLTDTHAALRAVKQVIKDWSWGPKVDEKGNVSHGMLIACECRQVKGDSGWLSPTPVDSLGIHMSFNAAPEWQPEVLKAVTVLEQALRPFDARAHWGKLAPLGFAPVRLAELYGDGLQRFRALCEAHDPSGRFRNAHVRQMFFA